MCYQVLVGVCLLHCSKLVTLASSYSALPDDGDYTETCWSCFNVNFNTPFNPLNPQLNPICYLLALLAHHFLHVSRIRVKSLTLRLLMSYVYGAHILDVSRLHTTTQHSR